VAPSKEALPAKVTVGFETTLANGSAPNPTLQMHGGVPVGISGTMKFT
jgi:hypothetical protein